MDTCSRVLVIGENSVEGKVLLRYLKNNGIGAVFTETSCGIDIMDVASVCSFLEKNRIDVVFLLHIQSGGILLNITNAAELADKNLQIQNVIIPSCYKTKVKKLIFLASSCVYPKNAEQPMKESEWQHGTLEETSIAYAEAKRAGIELCNKYNVEHETRFACVIPASIYGPHDNFDLDSAHVMAALIRKCYEACQNSSPEMAVWGTGEPRREFVYVDDLIDALMVLIEKDFSGIVNVGSGDDHTILSLAEMISKSLGFHGTLSFDSTKPDGVFQKLLDSSLIRSMGWKPKVTLQEGITKTCAWFAQQNKE